MTLDIYSTIVSIVRLHESYWGKYGKSLAPLLSRAVAHPKCATVARYAEAYWCILLGKGAGTGWALDTEVDVATRAIKVGSPVVFDVGANRGMFSQEIFRRFPNAQIFMFEPQPACQSILKSLDIPGSTIVEAAVGAEAGKTLRLWSDGATSGLASLHPRGDSFSASLSFKEIDVSMVTIDQIVAEHTLDRVDFMKVDTEGHDLHVLEGAAESLHKGIIKSLSFEFGAGNVNSRTFFRDFWDLLDRAGYLMHRILPSGGLLRIPSYYEDCEYFRGVSNYFAVR